MGFVFESWFSRLHLTGRSQFQAHIYVRNGSVAVVNLLYVKRDGVMIAFRERTDRDDPANLLGFSVSVQNPRTANSKLQLTMRTNTPLEVRRTPMDVDLSCLGRISTCHDAQDIIPDLQSLHFVDQS